MAKPIGTRIAKCPNCGTDVGDAHPYQWCVNCGEFLPQEILERLPLVKKAEQTQAEAVAEGKERLLRLLPGQLRHG